jgi:5-(aminomethyl)-3-furanmethanol phosphate kinase
VSTTRIKTVIKVGGALLDTRETFAWATDALSHAPRDGTTLIVPGGGPFADAVRDVDRRIGLSADAAHWAAVLAMDQYAHVLADRVADATVVDDLDTPTPGRLPIFAPYAWLRSHDALPHSWDVTADSIAAWVARALGARRLLLLKLDTSTDAYFETAVPNGCGLETQIVLAGASIQW